MRLDSRSAKASVSVRDAEGASGGREQGWRWEVKVMSNRNGVVEE